MTNNIRFYCIIFVELLESWYHLFKRKSLLEMSLFMEGTNEKVLVAICSFDFCFTLRKSVCYTAYIYAYSY